MTRADQLDDLFALLFRCAQNGQSCPTNEALSQRYGYTDPRRGMRLIGDLETAGRITVERTRTSRIVTLVGHTIDGRPARTRDTRRSPSAAKPRVSAAVIRAAKIDGRDLPTFVTALIGMGLDCWLDERRVAGEPIEGIA